MTNAFQTIAFVISFVTNGVGITSLKFILDNDELKNLKAELEGQIKIKFAEPNYVKKKYKQLIKQLWNPFIYMLHLLNIAILTCLVIILIYGPQSIFGSDPSSTLSEPLTRTDKVLYFIWLIGGLITYALIGVLPFCNLFILKNKTKKWIKINDYGIKR